MVCVLGPSDRLPSSHFYAGKNWCGIDFDHDLAEEPDPEGDSLDDFILVCRFCGFTTKSDGTIL